MLDSLGTFYRCGFRPNRAALSPPAGASPELTAYQEAVLEAARRPRPLPTGV